MGTRSSRHHYGRKPLYKEHGADAARDVKRKWEEFYVNGQIDWHAVEKAANELLPDMPPIEYGDSTIHHKQPVNTGQTRKFGGLNERQKVGHFVQRLDAVVRKDNVLSEKVVSIRPNKEPAPLRDTPIEYHQVKTSHAVCDKCGKPRMGHKPLSPAELKKFGLPADFRPLDFGQKRYCKACYRLVARENRVGLREALVVEAEIKRSKVIEKRNALVAVKETIFSAHHEAAKAFDNARQELSEAVDSYTYWIDTFDLSVPGFLSGSGEGIGVQARGGAVDFLWAYRLTVTPDFTIRLFDLIEEAELETGIPYALWLSEGVMVVPEGDREVQKAKRAQVFRHDPRPRQNVRRMQQAEWRYEFRWQR